MIDIPTVSSIVTAASIIVGVVFTILEIRHLNRVRRTDIIMKIYDKFGSREMVEAVNKVGVAEFRDLKDYREKYDFTGVTQVAILFDGVGVLLEQGLIDIKMADCLFGATMKVLWIRIKPVIYAMREGLNEPAFFAHFEYLINRLEIYRKNN